MSKYKQIISSVLLLAVFFMGSAFQNPQDEKKFPWSPSEVIQPKQLADKINNEPSSSYVILNIGPVEDIKNARNIGAVIDSKNLDKLKKQLNKISKDREVIFYCGCCEMKNCPNIEPTYTVLKEMGFKKVKVLDINESLYMDWISHEYPMP